MNTKVAEFESRGETVHVQRSGGYYYLYVRKEKPIQEAYEQTGSSSREVTGDRGQGHGAPGDGTQGAGGHEAQARGAAGAGQEPRVDGRDAGAGEIFGIKG